MLFMASNLSHLIRAKCRSFCTGKAKIAPVEDRKLMPPFNGAGSTCESTSLVSGFNNLTALNRLQRPCFFADDDETLASQLRRCAFTRSFSDGQCVHEHVVRIGVERDVFLGSLLVHMYGNCGALEDALDSFAKLYYHDQFSWNFLIAAHARYGEGKEALRFFDQMLQEGMVPNQFIIPSILSACADQIALNVGKRIHAHIGGSSYESDVAVGNAIVNMYGKCDSLKDARIMFDRMGERNTFSWTAMIAVYAQHGQGKEALQLFDQMQREGILPNSATFASILCACASEAVLDVGICIHSRIGAVGFQSDVTVANALVNMYGKCGSLGEAWRMFNQMPERNIFSWNAVITAYVQYEQSMSALQLFHQMRLEGFMPNKVTFISILSTCAAHAALAEGKRIHVCLGCRGFELEITIANALLHMYAKCGSLEETWRVFDDMSEPDAVSWTAVIAAYAQHGQGKLAIQLFDNMHGGGVMPNDVTFLSILSACSRAGLIDEGHHWLSSMNSHCITPLVDHYNCIVDLLGRAGRLREAEELISSMPYQPTLVSWMTLLGACKNQSDLECGERAASHVFELDPHGLTPHIMLSNIYAAVGHEADAVQIMKELTERGLNMLAAQ